jgi:hypothetical protein
MIVGRDLPIRFAIVPIEIGFSHSRRSFASSSAVHLRISGCRGMPMEMTAQLWSSCEPN